MAKSYRQIGQWHALGPFPKNQGLRNRRTGGRGVKSDGDHQQDLLTKPLGQHGTCPAEKHYLHNFGEMPSLLLGTGYRAPLHVPGCGLNFDLFSLFDHFSMDSSSGVLNLLFDIADPSPVGYCTARWGLTAAFCRLARPGSAGDWADTYGICKSDVLFLSARCRNMSAL